MTFAGGHFRRELPTQNQVRCRSAAGTVSGMDYPDPWPLRHLVLRTPRLELRPDDDSGLLELVDKAYHGIHPPEQMPFSFPFTDAPHEELGRNILQHHWRIRADCSPAAWRVNLLVRLDGRVIGTQGISGKNFAVTREVHSGSWIGLRHQGNGFGIEIRAAMLLFAFDYLGAIQARSDAFSDNAKSLAVSSKLGYAEDGTQREQRRGEQADVVRLLLAADRFVRPAWEVEVHGFVQCKGFFGL